MKGLDPDLRALQEVRDAVERAHLACESIASWDQARTDAACAAVAKAAAAASADLARMTVEETGIGRVHYKVLKNLFGSEGTWESIKDEKTVGIISRDERKGVIEVATASGVIAGIVPTTNPVCTAFNKALISIKGRNAIVISPHPRARRSIFEACEVMRRALERNGAPADLVVCLSNPTIESTGALMKHPKTALILATGGSGLVTAAYSSGRPAYGVGPGNVPCYVDRSANVKEAARWVTSSQSFDNATLCCSEQALVLDRPIADEFLAEMVRRGAHLCNAEETDKLGRFCNVRGHMNADVVGLDPWRVAELSGFSVPRSTTVLLAHQGGVGKGWPLSIEILCPLLSVHLVDGWKQGCEVSLETLRSDGLGHTISVWAEDEQVLDAWFLEKPANRIVVNGPSSQGATGYSTGLDPAMSLGCGPQAGNITSDNITARHLVNIKRAAFRNRDFEEQSARAHARAAELVGDSAPRGSGLPGDPGLRGGRADGGEARSASTLGASNWQGNPPHVSVVTRPSAPKPAPRPAPAPPASSAGMTSKVGPASKSRPIAAPTFTSPQPASAARPTAAPRPAPTTAQVAAATAGSGTGRSAMAGSGPGVGSALTPSEIQGIMAHAGAGCPLGPCKGCPHQDVRTGACNA